MGGFPSLEEIEKNCREFRFVVLYHRLPDSDERKSHWDLLMESPAPGADQLIAFAVSAPPEEWKGTRAADRLPDHRSIYLTYEGPISGNRGDVHRLMAGIVRWIHFSPTEMQIELRSPILDCRVELRMDRPSSEPTGTWQMTTCCSTGNRDRELPPA